MAHTDRTLTQRRQTAMIEGPTREQARRMAASRMALLRNAERALAAGQDDQAFDLDLRAFDLEADLIRYGFERLIEP